VVGETVWLIASASGGPKAAALQGSDLLLQQLVGHGHLAELGIEAEQLLLAPVALALLHRRLRRDQGSVAPVAQAGGGDVQFAGQGLERFAAEQTGHCRQFAFSGKAPSGPAPPEEAPAPAFWARAPVPPWSRCCGSRPWI